MPETFLGELLGTMTLVIFGDGVVAGVLLKGSKAENSGWIVVTVGWCLAVMMGVFVASTTGSVHADINPAVTLAKYLEGIYPNLRTVAFIMIAQVAGGFLGGVLVWLHYYPHWQATEDPARKLAVFCTVPAIRKPASNLWAEIFGTIVLVFCVHCIFAAESKSQPIPQWIAPYLLGLLVWGIGLSLGGPTGYAINPARDLGPRIAHAVLPIPGKGGSDWGYAWIPVAGPMIGGVIAYFLALWAGTA
jgi:glycerol uptake facilitator protein